MATEIYQSNAGYLWVEDREIPLFDTQWIHSTNNGFDYITIMNGDSVAIKNAALRHIVDNNGNGYANLAAWTTWWNALLLNAARPYFVYTAFITQTGTNAPVASVLENTIGAVVWSYSAIGTYLLTKTGTFVSGKTVPDKLESYIDDAGNKYTLERTSANVMTLKTYAAADTSVLANAVLSGQYVNIQIYE